MNGETAVQARSPARSPATTQLRPAVPATAGTHPAMMVVAALAGTAVAALAFSRATGLLGQVVQVPVGTFALAAAVILTVRTPGRYGWGWHDTGRHWRAVLAALVVVVSVVAVYRALDQTAPYPPSVAEFVIVPLGEEALFRGFVVTVLALAFTRSMPPSTATAWAVAVAAVGFGVGHLGNLGYVPAGFVLIQAVVATAFGLLAGWLRVRTGSLVGPVLLHSAMNITAVV